MRRLLPLAALLVAVASRSAHAQPAPFDPPERARIVAAARDVMRQAHFTTLITVSDDGQPQARVLEPSEPEADLTVWLATSAASRKVSQLRQHPAATLHYFDKASMAYVTLLGSAQVVSDTDRIREHWRSQWSPFFPGGPQDGQVVLIRFVPHALEIVSGAHALTNAPDTLLPVVLDLKSIASGSPR